MIEQHKGHNITDAISAFGPCKEMVSASAGDVQTKIGELMSLADDVNQTLVKLDEDEDTTKADIGLHFDALRDTIKQREASLLLRVEEIASRKRAALTEQLDRLHDCLDSCRHAALKAESLLEYNEKTTQDMKGWGLHRQGEETTQSGAAVLSNTVNSSELYLISSTKVIVDRCTFLCDQAADIPTAPVADPSIHLLVDPRILPKLDSLIATIGSIQSVDQETTSIQSPEIHVSDSDNGITNINTEQFKSANENSLSELPPTADIVNQSLGNVIFTIQASAPPLISTLSNQLKSENSFVIELRSSVNTSIDKSTTQNKDTDVGNVIAQVIVETAVDKRFFPRHEVLNIIESFQSNSTGEIPVLRVVSEILAHQRS